MMEAFYAALDDAQHCQHVLQEAQSHPKVHLLGRNNKAFVKAFKALSGHSDVRLTAQLTALACLARLYDVEAGKSSSTPGCRARNATSSTPVFDSALGKSVFPCAVESVAQALQVQV